MPATTNLLQFNPGGLNQETDVQYAADSLRSGGAVDGAFFDAILANKLFYQLTTMMAAIAALGETYGISTSDVSLITLMASIQSIFAACAGMLPKVVAFSATPVFAATLGGSTTFETTLTGNVTGATLPGTLNPGSVITFIIHQDATGGRTFAWPGNVPGAVVDPTASATSVQQFIVDSAEVLHPLGVMTVS
jgi:hypothetical protein